MSEGYDMVSDLNGTATEGTVPANTGTTSHGTDAVSTNNQNPVTREPVAQAKIVGAKEAPIDGDKPKSVRDLISGALKGETTATPDAAQQDGRARNPDGTFASKVDPAVVADPAAPALVAAPVTAAPTGIDPQVFSSLPAETQVQLARTMEDVQTRQQRFARLEPIERLIEPRISAWALSGMAPETALHQLFALSDFAGRDPGGFIKYMANVNNVDLEQLVLGMGGEEQVDPVVAELNKRIAELENGRTQEQRQQQQAAHDERVSNVVTFATEKGGDGQPLRPYFDELGNDILPFISAVKSQNPQWTHTQVLQEAYDRACWGTPSVRSKMQAAADAAGAAERLRQGTERVDAAKAASASVRSGVPTTPPAAPNEANRSTRDVIRAAIAQHS
jgi:hypothetical protein